MALQQAAGGGAGGGNNAQTSATSTTPVIAQTSHAVAATTPAKNQNTGNANPLNPATSHTTTTAAPAVVNTPANTPLNNPTTHVAATTQSQVIVNPIGTSSKMTSAIIAGTSSISSISHAANSTSATMTTTTTSSSSIPSSSIASSSSSTSTTIYPSASAAILDGQSEPSTSTKKSISTAEIGEIVGGAAGGLLLVALIWWWWRRRRERRDQMPPPPPRSPTFNSQSLSRNRASMMSMRGGSAMVTTGGESEFQRASSYSTLLNARPSSTYQHSRHPSTSGYYSSYPIATPSSISHEPMSPPVFPVPMPHGGGGPGTSSSSEPSPPLSGIVTPISAPTHSPETGSPVILPQPKAPSKKPSVSALDTNLQRAGSGRSHSDSSSGRSSQLPKNKSSIDRLRHEAGASTIPHTSSTLGGGRVIPEAESNQGGASSDPPTRPSSRAPSPSFTHPDAAPSDWDLSSRATSPNPSSYGFTSPPRQNTNFGPPAGRPYSTYSNHSMGQMARGYVGNTSGAPHQGRAVALEMPRLLGATQSDAVHGGGTMQRRSMEGLTMDTKRRSRASLDFGPISPQSNRHSTAQTSHGRDNSRGGIEEVV